MTTEKIKMGILGEAWAERLRNYSCPRLVRLFYTTRRLSRTNSLVYIIIRTEAFLRLRAILSDVASRKILLFDRRNYLASAMATVIRSMDDVPWDEFYDWAVTVAHTEAYCCPRFWKMANVPGFISDQRLHHMAILDRFLQRVEYKLGSQALAVAQQKMEGRTDTHIADAQSLGLDDLRDLLAEIAELYRKCRCSEVDTY